MDHFAQGCGGDVRSALNALEACRALHKGIKRRHDPDYTGDGGRMSAEKSYTHDKNGDAHYDVLSAFQKSIRGSDANAALHYLARLIEAGDLESISRRLLVIAYEDIGLASPQAGPGC